MGFCFALAAALPAIEAAGQLQVGLKLRHTSVLQFEPAIAFVLIYNNRDVPLVFGEEAAQENKARLNFIIEKERGNPVARTDERPLAAGLKIMPDQVEEARADMSLCYDITSVGRYLVRAQVEWNGGTFESGKVAMDVVSGIELARASGSVPGHPDSARSCSLRYWPRENCEYLFLRVDEEKIGVNYGVFQLGRLVRVFKPLLEFDGTGTVTVKHQSGPDCYTYSVFKLSPDSANFVKQTYHLPNGDAYPQDNEAVSR